MIIASPKNLRFADIGRGVCFLSLMRLHSVKYGPP